MRSLPLSIAALLVLCSACGSVAIDPAAKTAAAIPVKEPAESTADDEAGDEEEVAQIAAREVGDYVVFHFSGSYKSGRRTLTERVVEQSDDDITLDMTLADGVGEKTIRVTLSETPETFGEVLAVSSVNGETVKPIELSAYDAMMKEIVLAADQNEALLGTEDVVVAVGEESIGCTKTRYRVKVGNKSATLSTLTSEAFPWGDVGGEIASEQGELIYRAELVAIGNGDAREALVAGQTAGSVALRRP
jgi:hypothetical protein